MSLAAPRSNGSTSTGTTVTGAATGNVQLPPGAAMKGAKAPAKDEGCCSGCCSNIASVMKSFIQFCLIAAALALVIVALLTYMAKKGTCSNATLPISTLALGVALLVLTLTSVLDLSMALCGKAASSVINGNPCIVTCRSLGLTSLAWGLVLAASAWELYELQAGGLFAQMWLNKGSQCDPFLYKSMVCRGWDASAWG